MTTFAQHPAVGRIRDLIAANEARRIDADWREMCREMEQR